MKSPSSFIVVQYSVAFKMTRKSYIKFLEFKSKDGTPDPADFGKELGVVVEPLDWEPEYCAEVLDNVKKGI